MMAVHAAYVYNIRRVANITYGIMSSSNIRLDNKLSTLIVLDVLHPLVFDEFPEELENVSISPREEVSYKEDKKIRKKYDKFFFNTSYLNDFITHMKSDVVSARPDDVLSYLIDIFFSDDNIEVLRERFK